MPIPPGSARRLQQSRRWPRRRCPLLAATRTATRWREGQHYWPFVEAVKAARLPDGASIYALRHTADHDGVVGWVCRCGWWRRRSTPAFKMVERTYSKFIRRPRRCASAAGAVRRRRAGRRQHRPARATVTPWAGAGRCRCGSPNWMPMDPAFQARCDSEPATTNWRLT